MTQAGDLLGLATGLLGGGGDLPIGNLTQASNILKNVTELLNLQDLSSIPGLDKLPLGNLTNLTQVALLLDVLQNLAGNGTGLPGLPFGDLTNVFNLTQLFNTLQNLQNIANIVKLDRVLDLQTLLSKKTNFTESCETLQGLSDIFTQSLNSSSSGLIYFISGPIDNLIIFLKEIPNKLIPSGIGNTVNNVLPDLTPIVHFILNGGLIMFILKLVFILSVGYICV